MICRGCHCDGHSVISSTCRYRFGSMRMSRICRKGARPGFRCHIVCCMSAHAGGPTRTALRCCTGHATLRSMRSTPFRPVARWLLCCRFRYALQIDYFFEILPVSRWLGRLFNSCSCCQSNPIQSNPGQAVGCADHCAPSAS
jgi:hypothetical protein